MESSRPTSRVLLAKWPCVDNIDSSHMYQYRNSRQIDQPKTPVSDQIESDVNDRYCRRNEIESNHGTENLRFRKSGKRRTNYSRPYLPGNLSTDRRCDAGGLICCHTTSEEYFKNAEKLLNMLKRSFGTLKSFSDKELAAEKVSGLLTELEPTKSRSSVSFALFGSEQLFKYCVETKQQSIDLQNYLGSCSIAEATSTGVSLGSFIPYLLTHPIGSYVIQRLLIKVSELEITLIKYFKKNINLLIHNEYSSRLIQLLIERDAFFRREMTDILALNPAMALASSPAQHIVCTYIKNSVRQSEIHFVVDWILRLNHRRFKKPLMKVLICYAQFCTEEQLDELFLLLKIQKNILLFLRSKSSSCFITKLIIRCHEPTTKLLSNLLSSNFSVTNSAGFRQLLLKLWEEPHCSATKRMAADLARLTTAELRHSSCRPSSLFCYYLFITIKTLLMSDSRDSFKSLVSNMSVLGLLGSLASKTATEIRCHPC